MLCGLLCLYLCSLDWIEGLGYKHILRETPPDSSISLVLFPGTHDGIGGGGSG